MLLGLLSLLMTMCCVLGACRVVICRLSCLMWCSRLATVRVSLGRPECGNVLCEPADP